MPKKAVVHDQPEPIEPGTVRFSPKWTNEELKANAHLGPGVLGQEMFEAVTEYMKTSAGGILGPATRGD